MSSSYCFWFCLYGVFALVLGLFGLLLPWWLLIIVFCSCSLPLVLIIVINYLCCKYDVIDEEVEEEDQDNVNHQSMNALSIPRPVARRQACRPDMLFSLSLTPMDPGRRGVINYGMSTSVYTNPSANQHTQLLGAVPGGRPQGYGLPQSARISQDIGPLFGHHPTPVYSSVYTNPSANQHTQIPIVNDPKENVLPTYENAKRYKTLSNPDGDPPPPYEVATLHM